MARTLQCLLKTHLPERSMIERAREIGEPENFFVGLTDARLPQPRNILIFCKDDLEVFAKDTLHDRYMLILNLETDVLHDMRNRTIDVPSDLWFFIEVLLAEYRIARKAEGTADGVAALLSLILLRLLRQCRQVSTVKRKPRLPLPAHRLVQRASHLIASHTKEPMTVEQIARKLAVSAGYLLACFRRVLGLRVKAFIRRSRVCSACALLSRTESNITEIAEHCGFGSIYDFSHAFKREIGMSPTRYRTHLWEQHNIPRHGKKSRSRSQTE